MIFGDSFEHAARRTEGGAYLLGRRLPGYDSGVTFECALATSQVWPDTLQVWVPTDGAHRYACAGREVSAGSVLDGADIAAARAAAEATQRQRDAQYEAQQRAARASAASGGPSAPRRLG